MNLINFLGIGTVAATKQTNTHEIMVYLPSMAPAADGRVVATVKEVEKKGVNAYGEETSSTVLTSNTFPAVWNSMGEANRITSPDVREGSKVAIYQVSGQNNYYWTTFGVNANTMRLETVIQGFSANPNIGDDAPFNIDNFYTMTVSTHDGFAAFRTTKQNKEKTTFEIKVDGKAGKVMIGGGFKNFFVLDDIQRSMTYVNADGSVFNVDRKTITASADDSITWQGKEQINFLTKNFNLKCKQISIEADTAEIRIGETKWIGNIEQKGNYNQQGNYEQKGNYDQTGNMDQKGNITSSGVITGMTDVKTAMVSLNVHFHGGVQNGNGVTSTPIPTGF